MKTCKYSKKIIGYLYNELIEDELAELKNHLDTCYSCQKSLNQLFNTKAFLTKRSRPLPQKKFLKSYHQKLKQIYQGDNLLDNFIQNILIRPSIAVRLAEITVILILGIFIGRNLHNIESSLQINNDNIVDTRILNNYLFETEFLLLEISNVDNEKQLKYIIDETNCKILLQKTIFLKDQAKQLNNVRLLDLLDRLEIILLEVANIEDTSSNEELSYVRKNIKHWGIFVELKALSTSNLL